MRIKKEVFDSIVFGCLESPVEQGGIIGTVNNVVTEYAEDKNGGKYGIYSPDTKFINETIGNWYDKGITFCGLYHSHFPFGNSLSSADINYIEQIMFAVRGMYDFLYFPIVIPHKRLIVYKAEIVMDTTIIKIDELFITDWHNII